MLLSGQVVWAYEPFIPVVGATVTGLGQHIGTDKEGRFYLWSEMDEQTLEMPINLSAKQEMFVEVKLTLSWEDVRSERDMWILKAPIEMCFEAIFPEMVRFYI